jgi:hypothetical protein
MTDPSTYDIPSAAGGDQGLEGFSLVVAGERVGRVAALNETPDGLVFLVDTGQAYRPVPADHLENGSRRGAGSSG